MTATPPQAIDYQSHWPGWIWAVPIAAVAIVAWLGIRSWTSTGPKITVIFPTIADLKPGNTEVKFQDLAMGRVESVKLEKDFRHMRVVLQMQSSMEGNLGRGTKFWIVGEGFTLTKLSDLMTIISGPYVAMEPAPGPTQRLYIGLTQAPVLGYGERATPFILHSETLSGVQRGTPIFYHYDQVGEVRSYRMADSGGFDIAILIKAPFDRLIHAETRFWNAGAIHISSDESGPSLQFHSLPALIEGAIAFETPSGPGAGERARPFQSFELYDGREVAENAPDRAGVSYRALFTDTTTSLSRNAPVNLMGSVVGSVSQAQLEYSPTSGRMSIDAIIVLEPRRIHLIDHQSWGEGRGQLDAMMEHLVAQGLRAEIASSPPAIGGHVVVLRMVPNSNGTIIHGQIPQIPTSAGPDIENAIQNAGDFTNKLNQLPLAEIGNEIHQSTSHIAALVSSPALPRTLRRVESSAANVEEVTAEARDQLPAALRSLRNSIAEAEATLASTQSLLAANPAQLTQPETADVPQALYEVTRAARSLRELSDFLDQHPEALIEGRR
jgi:paraquat-inducible protein B